MFLWRTTKHIAACRTEPCNKRITANHKKITLLNTELLRASRYETCAVLVIKVVTQVREQIPWRTLWQLSLLTKCPDCVITELRESPAAGPLCLFSFDDTKNNVIAVRILLPKFLWPLKNYSWLYLRKRNACMLRMRLLHLGSHLMSSVVSLSVFPEGSDAGCEAHHPDKHAHVTAWLTDSHGGRLPN